MRCSSILRLLLLAPRRVRIARTGICVLAPLFAILDSSSAAAPSLEWAVKAEYLFKLVPFIDWPESAFASPAQPFRLCVVGDDPFDGLLDEAGQGQSAGQHPIAIVRLKNATPDDHCQLMYIAGDQQFVTQSLSAASGFPVLTVTDAQSGDKGIVNFVNVQNHVRFEIDQQAALRNHLNVSSKLLGIALPQTAGHAP